MLDPLDKRCARLAAWGTAVLRNRVSIDSAMDALAWQSDLVDFSGLDGEPEPVGAAWALGLLRRNEVTGLAVVNAFPGDAAGLPGPIEFNAEAIRAGAAVVSVDGIRLGLLPHVDVRGPDDDALVSVHWHAHSVASFSTAAQQSLAQAERHLVETLQQSLRDITALDVAQWRDEVADLLQSWRQPSLSESLPPGLSERAAGVVHRTERLAEILTLALDDEGAAVSASEASVRRTILLPLAASVRSANAAAWNCGLSPAASLR